MGNNNKRKITGCVGGVIMLLLVTALTACGADSGDAEVASITEAAEIEEPITEEANTEETETEDSDTEEADTEETETEEADTEEADTEETDTEEPAEETETSNSEDPAAETANTESNNTESAAASPAATSGSWGTPQEYNGDPEGKGPGRIIVKGFDYNSVFGDMTWRGEYWTASNGVEIKIISVIDYTGGTGMVPVPDGKGKDNEPDSPFQAAMAEANGDNINKFDADLNVTLPLATYKRTEININDANIVAYRNAYDYKLFAINGQADSYKPYQYGEPINMRLAVASDGIGEFDELGAKFWSIRKVNDYWEVRINANLAAFRWDGIHQVLRYLSPDGDSLYDVIYEDFYYGSPVILEYEDWFAVGNSQIYQQQTTDMGYVIYRFK